MRSDDNTVHRMCEHRTLGCMNSPLRLLPIDVPVPDKRVEPAGRKYSQPVTRYRIFNEGI